MDEVLSTFSSFPFPKNPKINDQICRSEKKRKEKPREILHFFSDQRWIKKKKRRIKTFKYSNRTNIYKKIDTERQKRVGIPIKYVHIVTFHWVAFLRQNEDCLKKKREIIAMNFIDLSFFLPLWCVLFNVKRSDLIFNLEISMRNWALRKNNDDVMNENEPINLPILNVADAHFREKIIVQHKQRSS